MNYVVPSCFLRNLKSISVGANGFYDLVGSKPFSSQGFVVSCLNLKVSFMKQDPIINIGVFGFLNMKGTLFVVDSFEDVVDVVMHSSHSIQTFFCYG